MSISDSLGRVSQRARELNLFSLTRVWGSSHTIFTYLQQTLAKLSDSFLPFPEFNKQKIHVLVPFLKRPANWTYTLLKIILKNEMVSLAKSVHNWCAFVMSEFPSKISPCVSCENNSWVVKLLKHTQPQGETWWNLSEVYFSPYCKKQTLHFSNPWEINFKKF